ncbi:MAG: hypothetical protein J0H15_12365, partial [Xanthomonadales bacterium]|nr:hypothetical protein [Xanthomonadales bacterium]
STYPEHGLQGLRFLSSHSGMYIPNWGPATLFDPATKFIPDSSARKRASIEWIGGSALSRQPGRVGA